MAAPTTTEKKQPDGINTAFPEEARRAFKFLSCYYGEEDDNRKPVPPTVAPVEKG